MTLTQDYPQLSEYIAAAMEQLGGISHSQLQRIELAARHIADGLARGSKLLVQSSKSTQILAESLRDDLLWRYREQQPALPVLLLDHYDGLQGQDGLREAEAMGNEGDTLLLLQHQPARYGSQMLQQLYQNRGIVSIYMGPDSDQLEQACLLGIELQAAAPARQLELGLFILHCLSARIQSLVFSGS